MKILNALEKVAIIALFVVATCVSFTYAADDTELTVDISDGALTIDIVDNTGTEGSNVANPTIAITPINFKFYDQSTTGTLGTPTQRIKVWNRTVTPTWSCSMAATNGITANWTGGTHASVMDFNDATAGAAQLTVNPSHAGSTIYHGNSGGAEGTDPTGVSKGSSAAFSQGSVDSITLFSADGTADPYEYFIIEGIELTQEVPARQPVDDYSIDMTITVSN